MHLGKAAKELWALTEQPPYNMITYAQVEALLSGFDRANQDLLGEGVPDTYAIEKISAVRREFQKLCGIGEGSWTTEQLIDLTRADIAKLKMIISEDGLHLHTPALAIAASERA